MDKLKTVWNGLQASERSIIAWGGLVLGVLLVYFYVFEPWHKAIAHYQEVVPKKRADLQWIKVQSDLAQRLQGNAVASVDGGTNERPLLTIIEQTAKQQGLRASIKQMTPGDKPNEVKVWLSEVNFDKWLFWVEQLKNSDAIEVKNANIQRGESGVVEIRATYSRI